MGASEGEFRIDTVRYRGERIWLVTRNATDVDRLPVIDSIWMDRYTLRTIRSVQRNRDGVTTMEFNRRQVRTERIMPDGRRRTWRGLHDAEPYALAGIELAFGVLPLRLRATGAFPVVSGMGDQLQWLSYEVVDVTQEPRPATGGMVFRPVWLVEATLGRQRINFWIDPDERAVIRRSIQGANETRTLVMRSGNVPRVESLPVVPLAAEQLPVERGTTRVLRQSSGPMQSSN
ncbi:MAG TPA: hypothetical protein PLL69_01380 [Gemmatimonadales bacterium]|nr:hypothetical protein [Gemmatimonadales bacterium]